VQSTSTEERIQSTNSYAKTPRVILGTWNFGKQVDETTADRMVGMFLEKGFSEIDTAYGYCDGLTEEILGRILTPERREKVYLSTKVNPFSEEGLRPHRVIEQIETSLRRLKVDHVDLLYLHAPDLNTPIEVTLDACYKLFRQGKYLEFGLSNFPSWQVVNIWHICRRNGWTAPTVFQGMYNAFTRDVERELFPSIRVLGIRFYAYNPLAGGLLTGKYLNQSATPKEGRFALYPTYLNRYWKEGYFKGLRMIREVCDSQGLSMADCSVRWMQHHSSLKGAHNDGMIIAATDVNQMEANLKSCQGTILSEDTVSAYDRAWEVVRPDCPKYFWT
jgi:aflatoxin B1 aldehyde reductase